VFLQKYRAPTIFPELMNYFSIEKGIDQVYGSMNRVHGAGSRGLRVFIKQWSSTRQSRAKIKTTKGYFH
jgi:hypothetical protein